MSLVLWHVTFKAELRQAAGEQTYSMCVLCLKTLDHLKWTRWTKHNLLEK